MKKNERFLNLYREYESLMREKGLDCKDFEDRADPTLSKRLYMCRQFRNYLSHTNDPGFLEISDSQIDFLQDRIEKLKIEEDILKKHLKSPKVAICFEKDKCLDGLQF